MSDSDRELFELCNDVYKRFPEWNNTLDGGYRWCLMPDGKYDTFRLSDAEIYPAGYREAWFAGVPVYTSDYIFGNLPAYINSEGRKWFFILCREISGSQWQTGFETIYEEKFNEAIYNVSARTPLTALLRLVVALHEGGELK